MEIRLWSRFATLLAGSQLRRNFTVSAGVNVTNILAGLLSYTVYLKYLSLAEYGVWIALSAVTSVVQLGGFGMGPAVTKYVAEERSRGDTDAVRAYSTTAFTLLGIFGIVIVFGVCVARTAIADMLRLPPAAYIIAKKLVPFVAVLSAYTFITQVPLGTLAGLGRQDQVSYVQAAARLVALGTSWAMLVSGVGVASLVVANMLALVITHVWTVLLIRRLLPNQKSTAVLIDYPKMRKMIRFGSGLMGSGLMLMLLHPLNRVILSRYGGITLLPMFEIAYSGAMQVRSLFAAAMAAMLPEFSRVDALGNVSRVRILTRRLYRIIYVAALPIQVVLGLCAPLALRMWLRSGFSWDQVAPFRIMLIGSFISLLGVPAYYYLAAVARVGSVLISHGLQSIVNIVVACGFLLIAESINPVQLSIAVSIGMASSTVWLALSVRKLLSTKSECQCEAA